MEFSIEHDGYKLPSGKIASTTNFENLDATDFQSLIEEKVSAYDLLRLRTSIHKFENRIGSFMSNLELDLSDIKESLLCDVSNGDKKKLPLNQVVAQLAEQHKHLRMRERLYKSIYENRVFIIIISIVIIFGTAVLLKNDWLMTMAIPFFTMLIKYLMK